MIFATVVVLFAHYIPVPTYIENEGVLEDFRASLTVIYEDSHLTWLLVGLMFVNACQANFGMALNKRENAVIKATVALQMIPYLWIY